MKKHKAGLLFLAGVAIGTLAVFLRIHSYSTGQDPRTFLLIAKSYLGGTASSETGLVIPGWPLVLAAVIRLFGIYAAFWTNVPLFVLLVWTLRALVEETTGRPVRSMAIAAGSALLLLDGYYLNPHYLLWVFRQTPMYLTGMLAMLCMARAVRRQAAGRLWAAAGWLAGGGVAAAAGILVRETGGLMLAPMGLYLLANALGWAGPAAPAGAPARQRWFLLGLLAAAGVLAGVAGVLAVMLLDVRVASGQIGFFIQQLPWVFARPFGATPWMTMLWEIPSAFGRVGFLFLIVGGISACRRRHRDFLFFFLLPALAYWGFDGTLPKFHRRFFLSTLTFLAPLALHGACLAADWVRSLAARIPVRIPSPRACRAAVWTAMGVWCAHVAIHAVSWGPRVSRADVEGALAAMAPWVGPDRPLLVDWRSRYVTDILDVFTDWPAEQVCPAGAATYVREPPLVYARPLDDRAMCDQSAARGCPADPILEDNARLEPIPGTAEFFLGDAGFRLERVLPWSGCHAECDLPPPPPARLLSPLPSQLLKVAAPAIAQAQPIRVSLQGRTLSERLRPGLNYLAVPLGLADAMREAGGGHLAFDSEAPIPDDFRPEWISPDDSLTMSFGALVQPPNDGYLSEEFRSLAGMPPVDRNYPGWPVRIRSIEFPGDGKIFLPEGLDGDGAAPATWVFSITMQPMFGDPAGTLSATVSLPDFPDVPPQTCTVAHTEENHGFRFRFPSLPRAPTVLSLHVEHDVDIPELFLPNPRTLNMQILRFSMDAIPTVDSLDIPLGRTWDGRLLIRGLHARENIHSPRHGRWTDGRAEIDMPLRPGPAYRLAVDYESLRPDRLPPAQPSLEWNGESLEASRTETGLAATIPAERIGIQNTLRIVSDTWSPADFGNSDTRALGIYLRDITASPI